MKKLLLIGSIFFVTATFTNCSNEELITSKDEFTVKATFEVQSRTALGDDFSTVTWCKGDRIYLFGGSSNAPMTLIEGAGEATGTFSGNVYGLASQLKYALYPIPTIADGTYSFNLAPELTYSENSNAPMLGSYDTHNVVFKNLTALVRIPLVNLDANQENVLKLTMLGITGTATVDIEAGELVFPEAGMGNEVTVTIPAGVTACCVDIPVPAKTYSHYEIELNGNIIASKTNEKSFSVEDVAILTPGEIDNDEIKFPDAVNGEYIIMNQTELILFAQEVNQGRTFAKETVKLGADIDLGGINWTPIGACNTPAYFQGTFDGQDYTIFNLNVDNSKDGDEHSTSGLFGWVDASKATIKNVNVDGATVKGSHWTGVIVGYMTGEISNCTVTNATVIGYNVNDDANGDKVGGIVGCLNEHSYLNNNTVTHSAITGNRDIGGIAGSVAASTYEMNNNKIENVVLTFSTIKSYASAGIFVSGRTAYVPGNTNTYKNVTIKYDGEVTNNTMLAAVIKAGTTDIELPEGIFIIPDEAKGKTLSFIGKGKPEDTVIATQDDGSYEGCDYSLDGSTVTFENISINTDSHTYTGYARCNGTYKKCIINGTYTLYGNSVFEDCTFNVSGDVYNIWTWGALNATFTGCTFNSDGKAMLLYSTVNTTLTINDCTFNDNGGLSDLKAAIEIANDYEKSYELIVNNTTVNGYEINDKGINTGTTLWANKNSMGKDNLNVVVDGVDMY